MRPTWQRIVVRISSEFLFIMMAAVVGSAIGIVTILILQRVWQV